MDNIIIETGLTKTKIEESYDPYELVEEHNSILYKVMPKFNFNEGVDIKKIVGRMIETAILHRALGLAAPQVGLTYNIFVIGAEKEFFPCINPTYELIGAEEIMMTEFCLSFPFLELNIKRPEKIRATYQDINGKEIIRIFSGISARTYIHESQHLLGITFQKMTKPLALKNGLKKREKHMKQFARNIMAYTKLKEAQK